MNVPRPPLTLGALARMAAEPLDLLVVGGGIVGAGVARDAALRGLKVGLLDRYDFAFGTSSRSSRLLHGGIRYLAQGRLRLVRQASIEKTILHRIAPHLVEPLAFLFPAYPGTGWPLWQLRIGVRIYDWMCRGRNFGRSVALRRDEVLARLPDLRRDGLTGAVRYFDGFTNDARLVLDTLRSAANAGALLANYVRFAKAARRGDRYVCEVMDELRAETMAIEARCIVNATGPWAQGLAHSRIKLRLTKGIHLVFDRSRLPVGDAVVITEGSRLLFVIPWGERVLVGTTDTDYTGPIESVNSGPEDVTYLLESLRRCFPQNALSEHDVVSSWAGLRPLIAGPDGLPSDLSRSHVIGQSQPGWWDVAGGKLTTYRLMAEQTVDQVVHALGRTVVRCRTAELPLLPPEEVQGISQIVPPAVRREFVAHFCTREWPSHLDDLMMRRTSWHYYYRDAEDLASQVAGWMGEILGWRAEQCEQELKRYRQLSDWPLRASRPLSAPANESLNATTKLS